MNWGDDLPMLGPFWCKLTELKNTPSVLRTEKHVLDVVMIIINYRGYSPSRSVFVYFLHTYFIDY
jgi:hypothetical protein